MSTFQSPSEILLASYCQPRPARAIDLVSISIGDSASFLPTDLSQCGARRPVSISIGDSASFLLCSARSAATVTGTFQSPSEILLASYSYHYAQETFASPVSISIGDSASFLLSSPCGGISLLDMFQSPSEILLASYIAGGLPGSAPNVVSISIGDSASFLPDERNAALVLGAVSISIGDSASFLRPSNSIAPEAALNKYFRAPEFLKC